MMGKILHRPPFKTDYKKFYHYLFAEEDKDEQVIPSLVPQWDHTPRSGWNGSFFVNATPNLFYEHAKEVLEEVEKKIINLFS